MERSSAQQCASAFEETERVFGSDPTYHKFKRNWAKYVVEWDSNLRQVRKSEINQLFLTFSL